ncbi:MAG: hypothetical protein IJU86_01385 [Firmicutes bacterium]|nr:hypothetical protein [Bacillota bacterium]
MNEEIEIKLNDMQEKDKHHSIRINQDATVGDLINKIKESKEIVGNGQFLYLHCKNGGPDNGLLSVQQNMSLKLSDFKINNDSELSFDVFDINNSYTKKVLAKLLANSCVVKIVEDENITVVFEKDIKYHLYKDKKFYSLFTVKLNNSKIKDLIVMGAGTAYCSYPIKNDRDDVYFKINFGDKVITDSENTDENELLCNMDIKEDIVLNIEITTWRNNEKVLTEKGWVKAIDMIEENKVEQEKEKKNVKNLEIKEIDETEINLINKNPQASKSEKKNDYINNNDGKKQKNKDMAEEEKEDVKEIEEKIDLINSNPQQSNNEINVTFDFLGKDSIKFKVKPDITFDNLVQRFKQEALKTDKNYFKGIDKISFSCDSKFILKFSGNTSLKEIAKSVEGNINIRVIYGDLLGSYWDVSDTNNKNKISNDNQIPISNYENQTPSSNWKRILCFVVGIFLLIAALVVFLVNPELLSLIIPLAVSGGISLLFGFLWNTIKSCLCRQNPEEISTEQLTETNEYNPNKITDLSDLNNNLSLENNQKNENGQEKTDQ